MARVRSPNYPFLSLPDAIERIKSVHQEEHHLAVDKDTIAKHMGYTGIKNGAALKTISAAEKYGLLESVNDGKMKVSDLAISILFPSSDSEKENALKEAAFKPEIFSILQENWQGAIPSDISLKSYLLKNGFSTDAADKVIKVYRETIAVTSPSNSEEKNTQEAQGISSQHFPRSKEVVESKITERPQANIEQAKISSDMKVSIVKDKIEVSAVLTSKEDVENLINALNATKVLLKS